jgi:hypothetical protein
MVWVEMIRYRKTRTPRLINTRLRTLEKRLLESVQLDREPPGSLERCAEAVEKEINVPGRLKDRIREEEN